MTCRRAPAYGLGGASTVRGAMRYSLLLLVAIAGAGGGAAVMLVVGPPATDIKAADWLQFAGAMVGVVFAIWGALAVRSEEHTSELQSQSKLILMPPLLKK